MDWIVALNSHLLEVDCDCLQSGTATARARSRYEDLLRDLNARDEYDSHSQHVPWCTEYTETPAESGARAWVDAHVSLTHVIPLEPTAELCPVPVILNGEPAPCTNLAEHPFSLIPYAYGPAGRLCNASSDEPPTLSGSTCASHALYLHGPLSWLLDAEFPSVEHAQGSNRNAELVNA